MKIIFDGWWQPMRRLLATALVGVTTTALAAPPGAETAKPSAAKPPDIKATDAKSPTGASQPPGASQPAGDSAKPKTPDAELARVDGKPIFNSDLDVLLAKSIGAAGADRANPIVRATLLNQLIDRHLVEGYLTGAKLWVGPEEIDVEMGRIKAELARTKQSLDQLLTRTGQTEASLRDELAWELSWQRLMKQQLTDAALEAYFNEHHVEFDGSELHVAHILLRSIDAGREAGLDPVVKQAEGIRQQILDKKITFEAAAQKYSAGPSREKGGDLGYIGRRGPMVEAFNRAAFALKKDEISPPVVTPFGVHLIRALSIKPGSKKWTDVRDQLRPALTEQLFRQTAAKQLPTAKIEFLGKGPHFKPGTTELVTPAATN